MSQASEIKSLPEELASRKFEEEWSFSVSDAEGSLLKVEMEPLRRLDVESLGDLLPYDGIRNTVHRSIMAKTGKLVSQTPEDGNLPRPLGFESNLERSTAIACLLHPNTYGLKCQPRKVIFAEPVVGVQSNTLDFLVTTFSGAKTYLYVKNAASLSKPKYEAITRAIRMALPEGFGFAVISEDSFPPVVRGNNERMFLAKRFPDPTADERLSEVLDSIVDVERFTVNELIIRCQPGVRNADRGRSFDAVLRAIADRRLIAPNLEIIDYPTVLGWWR